MKNIYSDIINKIKSGRIKTQKQLELEKIRLAKKENLLKIPRNADIIIHTKNQKVKKFLGIKPVRTASGIANIAVMWLPEKGKSCPGKCIYCPQGFYKNKKGKTMKVPKSYTGYEPATMRARHNNFDPYKQVENRLHQLNITGHNTDKCELIVMGGTFMSAPRKFRRHFIKRCLDAFNMKTGRTLEQAQKLNEKAKHRCIGMTIETRADFCRPLHIKQMLELGCTRVELGVQTTDNKILKKIRRMHDAEENIKAIKNLKNAGMKVCVHWMPGLTGISGKINIQKEIEMFAELFKNPYYRPDELKIYPTLVIENTELYELWKKGLYKPLTPKQIKSLLLKIKKIIPEYVRIKRIMRDISEKKVVAGTGTTNLRQLIRKDSKCRCIRCREIGLSRKKPDNIEFRCIEYNASDGREFFMSYEDFKNKLLIGFLRLRIDKSNTAKIRELHVYGQLMKIGKKPEKAKYQHRGYGKKLLQKAELIATANSKKAVQITSGIGVHEYYKKFGYSIKKPYMFKYLKH